MPRRAGEGSGARQKPKTTKTNLETDEYASNPPFSKIYPTFRGNNGLIWLNSGGNDGFKKIENLEFLRKVLSSRTLARKLFQII